MEYHIATFRVNPCEGCKRSANAVISRKSRKITKRFAQQHKTCTAPISSLHSHVYRDQPSSPTINVRVHHKAEPYLTLHLIVETEVTTQPSVYHPPNMSTEKRKRAYERDTPLKRPRNAEYFRSNDDGAIEQHIPHYATSMMVSVSRSPCRSIILMALALWTWTGRTSSRSGNTTVCHPSKCSMRR